jgi:hypothetical protein
MKARFLILFVFLFQIIFAQTGDRNYFRPPLDIPLVLSGNFGELRPNHFHSGIDLRTQGRTGLPVFAAADGFVSRIRISAVGFGLALYIDHPAAAGTTTVYAHLLGFNDNIQAYARKIQYEKESFEVDLTVPKGLLPVKKGAQIGLSGNSGGSGGAHLHFEIRDTKSEHPLNPLSYNFPVTDKIKPKILSVMVYPLSDDAHVGGKPKEQLIETVFYNNTYHLKGNPTISVYGDIGFGLQALDYLDGNWSKCGVYEIKLSVDEILVYAFKMDELDFNETRYLNSHIDYAHYRQFSRRVHKSWVEPGNKLNNYPAMANRGITNLSDEKLHKISYEVTDVYGNKSTLMFNVLSKKVVVTAKETGKLVRFDQENEIETEILKVIFREGTFYSDFYLDYNTRPANNLFYSPRFKLHNDLVPVHHPYQIKIKADGLPKNLREKAVIAAVDENSGRKWSMGGVYDNGWVSANVRQLGTFALSLDTIAPTIHSLSIKNGSLAEQNQIRFTIKDDFSGISDYRGEIDGHWALFEYDAKNNLISYRFDKELFQFGKSHALRLSVTDAKGNKAEYKATFYR